MSSPSDSAVSDKAFSYPGFRFFWTTTVSVSFAVQIMTVAIAYQIYDVTGDKLLLGLVGLSIFLPSLLLILVTGLAADRISRRLIMRLCLALEFCCAIGFAIFAEARAHEVWPLFALLVTLGIARAFWGPAVQSLAPNLVPTPALANALTMSTAGWQAAGIMGPAIGGLLQLRDPGLPFVVGATLLAVSSVVAFFIPQPAQRGSQHAGNLETMFAGFRYIFSNKVVLGAISLDMFAVLMGGAVALLPVYAKDILHGGSFENGLLRAAPGAGAILMGLVLTVFPIRDRAGRILFIFVGLFGAFTVLFGLSTSIWLSIFALACVGACDMVSVVIRDTIMQLWTPEEVRGRVNAVNHVFIGASNELGEFRAGSVASIPWIGPVVAVVAGGVGSMLVAAIWAWQFPQLREQRTLDKKAA